MFKTSQKKTETALPKVNRNNLKISKCERNGGI